jgi:hypothetical protein
MNGEAKNRMYKVMRNRRTLAIVALLAAAVLAPAAALARGGFAHGGHGPVFGLHHAPIVAHRPFRPVFAHRFPARFAHGWRLHRFARRHDADGGAFGPYAGDVGYPVTDPTDVTGTIAVPAPTQFAPPAPERVGCFARGYDVPGESGGIARVTVTRC